PPPASALPPRAVARTPPPRVRRCGRQARRSAQRLRPRSLGRPRARASTGLTRARTATPLHARDRGRARRTRPGSLLGASPGAQIRTLSPARAPPLRASTLFLADPAPAARFPAGRASAREVAGPS